MKKLLLVIMLSAFANAYTIGGAYARLVSCNWTSYGYQHGYVGTYDVNGKRYQIFFDNRYCSY